MSSWRPLPSAPHSPGLAPRTGTAVAADPYPSRPVRIVVAYPPGGAVDTIARKVAQKLSEQMGQQFVIENKPGPAASIGAREVARAQPDGHTLLAIDNTYAILPYVFNKLPWNHATDLIPITVSAFSPIMLVVGENSRFADLQALVNAARQEPEKVTYGTGGNGSAPHFSAEAFQQAANVKLFHVPYKGAGEAVVGVMSEQVDLVMASPPSVMGNIRGGQMRWRSAEPGVPALPDVPTFRGRGAATSVLNWSGLAAPKGTSPEIGQAAGGSCQSACRTGREGVPGGARVRTGWHDARCLCRTDPAGNRALARYRRQG